MNLGSRLRHLRIWAGFTQRSLAQAIDVHFTAVSHIERGTRQPSIELLDRWATACHASIAVVTQDEAAILEALTRSTTDIGLLRRVAIALDTLSPDRRLTLLALLNAWDPPSVSAARMMVHEPPPKKYR